MIDASGLAEAELRVKAPELWQQLHDRVFPERQENRDPRVARFALTLGYFMSRLQREDPANIERG